jgi:predicted transcriptional regulator
MSGKAKATSSKPSPLSAKPKAADVSSTPFETKKLSVQKKIDELQESVQEAQSAVDDMIEHLESHIEDTLEHAKDEISDKVEEAKEEIAEDIDEKVSDSTAALKNQLKNQLNVMNIRLRNLSAFVDQLEGNVEVCDFFFLFMLFLFF